MATHQPQPIKNDRMRSSQYESLNDIYTIGDTEIWYCKEYDDDPRHDFMLYGFSKDLILPKSHADLENTHVLLGRIRETNLERIFCMMQGEEWSRHGEARNFINGLNLCHTSMCVGDIIVLKNKPENEVQQAYICGKCGFDRLF